MARSKEGLGEYYQPQALKGAPRTLGKHYEWYLDRVPRWDGRSTKPESDLDHVLSMYKILDKITLQYPDLVRNLNLTTVRNMIYIHDAGELPPVGDLARFRLDYSEVRPDWKKREAQNFNRLTKRFIKDDETRKYVRSVYRRYVKRAPNDPEALFTHLLDKIQGMRFASEYVYNTRGLPADESLEQARTSVDLIIQVAKPLSAIIEGEAKLQLSALVQVEIGHLLKANLPQIAEYGRRQWFEPKGRE